MSDHLETLPRDQPAKQIGILLFEGVEELDAMGPWEVLSHWTQEYPEDEWQVALVSLDGRPVAGAKGAILTPHDALPRVLDAIVVPGGAGTRPLMRDEPLLARLREFHATGTLVTSVCTGALVLAVAGLLQGRPATTYHACFDELIAAEPTVLPRRDARWVDDGDIVTSAGVSAGIDMSLHLVRRLAGESRAVQVKRGIEYDPEPPI